MSQILTSYRPTQAAFERKRGSGVELPHEIHVHADGRAVAVLPNGHGDKHFTSLFGLLDAYGIGTGDVEGCN